MFGLTISSIWYWCSDQVIVQRALAAKSMVYAKAGSVFASYLKLLPLWIMVFPGMAARALFPNEVACATPDECEAICNSRYSPKIKYSPPYYISPIEIGLLWAKITYLKSHVKALVFNFQTDMK